MQHVVAESQSVQLESILNNRSVAAPVLTDAFQSGFEMFFSRGYQPWVDNENGLYSNVLPFADQMGVGAPWRLSVMRDMVRGAGSSSPSWRIVMHGLIYFVAYTVEYGTELWVTDGTSRQTTLVKDIFPGPTGSFPTYLTPINEYNFLLSASGVSTNWITRADDVRTLLVLAVASLARELCYLLCLAAVLWIQAFHCERWSVLHGSAPHWRRRSVRL